MKDNHCKLEKLLTDVFLLEPGEYRLDLTVNDLETWDSLATVAMAVGVQETLGYHMTPEEAMGIRSFSEIVQLLKSKGIDF